MMLSFTGIALAIAAFDANIVSVKLKFQDSSGYSEKVLSEDKLPKNLEDYIKTIRAAEQPAPKTPTAKGKKSLVDEMLDGCMCDSPSDSLEIRTGEGRIEKYEIYCSSARRVLSGDSHPLELAERQINIQSNRWQAIRFKYCPKDFGCSDSRPPNWHFTIESPLADRYSDEHHRLNQFGLTFGHVLDSSKVGIPTVPIVFTYHAKNGKITDMAIDSLDPKFAEIGRSFIRNTLDRPITRRGPDSGTVKITAYNAWFEK
jgi:hypothetical protein